MRGEVTLTDAGKTFKAYADNIMHWYHAAGDVFSTDNITNHTITIASDPFVASYILPQVISTIRSGGDYRFDIRTSPKGDEDITLSLKLHTDKIDFDGANTLIGSIPAAMVVSERTKESLDKKRKFFDNIPIVVWSRYAGSLPLDLYSRVVVKSESVEQLRQIVQDNYLLGVLPYHMTVIDDLQLIPDNLHYLQVDLHMHIGKVSSFSSEGIELIKKEMNRVISLVII